MTAAVLTRLHITPLDRTLLPIALGPRLLKTAENISFQSVETFPENDYGFIDLPEADAKTLISKLNGAILKGRKMKVEKARSRKRSHDALQQDNAPGHEEPQKKAKKSKKDKYGGDGVIDGYQITTDRKVKRGWTEPKSDGRTRSKSKSMDKTKKSKRQAPSQYTDKAELLFQTELPPNKQHLDQTSQTKGKGKGKDNQTRNTATVVHEFRNNEIQPAFVRDAASSAQSAQYVDNTGWVDVEGNVIEAATPSLRKNSITARPGRIETIRRNGAKTVNALEQAAERVCSTSTSDSASDSEDSNDEPQVEPASIPGASFSTSEADSSSTSDGDDDQGLARQVETAPRNSKLPDPATPQKVHPLEALFKRPQPPAGREAPKPSLEIETSFSFFDQSAADVDEDVPAMPATPFTSNDMRSREVRSAAPTPDTAHPSRFTGFAGLMASRSSSDKSKNDDLPDPAGSDPSLPVPEKSDVPMQSDFEKRFWAERGQNNRAWKLRRKTALKEQRQKDNRMNRPRNW